MSKNAASIAAARYYNGPAVFARFARRPKNPLQDHAFAYVCSYDNTDSKIIWAMNVVQSLIP